MTTQIDSKITSKELSSLFSTIAFDDSQEFFVFEDSHIGFGLAFKPTPTLERKYESILNSLITSESMPENSSLQFSLISTQDRSAERLFDTNYLDALKKENLLPTSEIVLFTVKTPIGTNVSPNKEEILSCLECKQACAKLFSEVGISHQPLTPHDFIEAMRSIFHPDGLAPSKIRDDALISEEVLSEFSSLAITEEGLILEKTDSSKSHIEMVDVRSMSGTFGFGSASLLLQMDSRPSDVSYVFSLGVSLSPSPTGKGHENGLASRFKPHVVQNKHVIEVIPPRQRHAELSFGAVVISNNENTTSNQTKVVVDHLASIGFISMKERFQPLPSMIRLMPFEYSPSIAKKNYRYRTVELENLSKYMPILTPFYGSENGSLAFASKSRLPYYVDASSENIVFSSIDENLSDAVSKFISEHLKSNGSNVIHLKPDARKPDHSAIDRIKRNASLNLTKHDKSAYSVARVFIIAYATDILKLSSDTIKTLKANLDTSDSTHCGLLSAMEQGSIDKDDVAGIAGFNKYLFGLATSNDLIFKKGDDYFYPVQVDDVNLDFALSFACLLRFFIDRQSNHTPVTLIPRWPNGIPVAWLTVALSFLTNSSDINFIYCLPGDDLDDLEQAKLAADHLIIPKENCHKNIVSTLPSIEKYLSKKTRKMDKLFEAFAVREKKITPIILPR